MQAARRLTSIAVAARSWGRHARVAAVTFAPMHITRCASTQSQRPHAERRQSGTHGPRENSSRRPPLPHASQLSAAQAAASPSTAKRLPLPPADGPPLPVLRQLMSRRAYDTVEAFVDQHFNPEKQTLRQFCGNAMDARDVVLNLMRVYVALGRMEKVRRIFLVALRDLSAIVNDDAGTVAEGMDSRRSPSFLNAGVFNGYLEALTRRKNFDKDEVIFVLDAMKAHAVAPNALTYHYLIELHIRAGYNPQPLWREAFQEGKLRPLPATVQALLLYVVPHASDGAFAVEVIRQALACGAAVLDKRTLAELIEQGLRDGHGSRPPSHAQPSPARSGGVRYPPEVLMWLMLELELRCVLDKASFVQYIQKQHVVELLLRCAKSADATTAAEALALLDRHVMTKTADVLSLVVWAWVQAGEVLRAFDMLELMARKGYLELTDPMKKYHVESLRYTMERNFLAVVADAVAATPGQLEQVLAHLRQRRADGLVVSVHALDVLVLAAAKRGEDRMALQLALSYGSEWGVQPRTATLNCLLVGCSTTSGGGTGSLVLLGAIYEAMLRAGVPPNPLTFRILIRQAVLGDGIDDAVAYLEEVGKHPGLRVEVEMILPIMERAARVGDGETVNRVSKFSLDCDIGIDGAVLNNVMKYLAEAGQSVEVLRGHQPLHEALRSRSKAGRQRARSELIL